MNTYESEVQGLRDRVGSAMNTATQVLKWIHEERRLKVVSPRDVSDNSLVVAPTDMPVSGRS